MFPEFAAFLFGVIFLMVLVILVITLISYQKLKRDGQFVIDTLSNENKKDTIIYEIEDGRWDTGYLNIQIGCFTVTLTAKSLNGKCSFHIPRQFAKYGHKINQ